MRWKIITIKELSQLYHLNKEIELQKEQLTKLESLAVKCTSIISDMPRGGSVGDKIASYAADIADLTMLLELNIKKYYYELNRLNRYIAGVDDSLTRLVLSLRFINGLSWKQVAYSVGGNNTDENVKKIAYRYINKNLSRMSRQDVVK